MEITRKNWMQYIYNLGKADEKAAELISDYLYDHEIGSDEGFNAFVDFFYSVVTKYAEGASEMAAQAYEALAEAQGATIKSAMPAETPSYGECKKAIRGTMLDSDQAKSLGQAAGRLVRRTGVDTTLNNALRDGAEWAWVPSGDTCAFCMMLASNGWQRASKKAIKNGHASHIHANCDCTYAIRFDGVSTVEGYDPDYYKALYDNAEGTRWQDKLNSMRRDKYAANPEKYREQKRIAYRARKQTELGERPVRKVIKDDVDVKSALENTFNKVDLTNIEKLDPILAQENATRLNKLEKKYGAIKETGASFNLDNELLQKANENPAKGVAVGVADYNNGNYELSLSSDFFEDREKVIQTVAKSVKDGKSVEVLEDFYPVYTSTHEYGHILQEALVQKEMQASGADLSVQLEELIKQRGAIATAEQYREAMKEGGLFDQIDELERQIAKVGAKSNAKAALESQLVEELEEIAKTLYAEEIGEVHVPGEDDISLQGLISKYGKVNPAEEWAESFTEMEGGKPGIMGKAMKILLERKGYKV